MRPTPNERFLDPFDHADCEALAPFVMALFDGEADEKQAQRARAHLIICQNCARRWLDWNTSRDLLRSVAVPAPPPTLLWRVLMACRLAAFTERKRPQPQHSQLSAQIMARTTRAVAPSTPAVSSAYSTKMRGANRFNLGLGIPSLAVPAVAMWLLVLQRDIWVPPVAEVAPTSEVAPVAPQISNRVLRPAISQRKVASSANLSALIAPHQSSVAKSVASKSQVISEADGDVVAAEKPVLIESSQPVRRAPRISAVTFEAPSAAIRAYRATPNEERAAPQNTPPVAAVSANATNAQPTVRLANTGMRSLKKAVLSDDGTNENLRTARWKMATPRLARAIEAAPMPQALRVSLPSAVSSSAAPAPRLIAENFDTDEKRIDEMRSVVDDFRASVASDDSSDNSDTSTN